MTSASASRQYSSLETSGPDLAGRSPYTIARHNMYKSSFKLPRNASFIPSAKLPRIRQVTLWSARVIVLHSSRIRTRATFARCPPRASGFYGGSGGGYKIAARIPLPAVHQIHYRLSSRLSHAHLSLPAHSNSILTTSHSLYLTKTLLSSTFYTTITQKPCSPSLFS